ncbi:MAG TPA: carboxypeptidase-like regulatory domain-containing protein [Pirellulales bacterium]
MLGLVLLFGCSRRPKNVVRVKGRVTLGGQPLSGATVTFTPKGEGSASRGFTNENGEYALNYAVGVDGAVIGEHIVSITTHRPGDPDAKPPIPDVPEKVPYKYRTGPDQLKATVEKKGENVIDFTLEAGPIEPPQPKGKGKGAKKK